NAQTSRRREQVQAQRINDLYNQGKISAAQRDASLAERRREFNARQAVATGKKAGIRPASEQINRSTGYIMGYNAQGHLVPLRTPNGKKVRYRPSKGASGSKKTDLSSA